MTTLVILVGLLAAALSATAGHAVALRRRLGTDAATGLANRDGLTRRVNRTRARRGATQVGLLLVDLDGFKQVNDCYGHETGNHVIRGVAGHLRAVALPGEVAVRLHGDEFVLWLGALPAGADGHQAARRRADAVTAALATPISTAHGPLTVTGSVGAAVLPAGTADLSTLLGVADAAMYQAKHTRTGRPPSAVHVA